MSEVMIGEKFPVVVWEADGMRVVRLCKHGWRTEIRQIVPIGFTQDLVMEQFGLDGMGVPAWREVNCPYSVMQFLERVGCPRR